MAAISPPIPPDIQKELVNPFTPWEVSQELFSQLEPPAPGALYRKVEVLPSCKEWRFIWRYFHHVKPLRYTIKRVYFIYERHQQKAFEINLSSIEREATSFPPTWDKESRASQRSHAIQRWKETAQIFSPFTTQEGDGRARNWKHTKVIPLWHGTNAPICHSICRSGFIYFGKTTIPGDGGAPPKSTDDGYFGSGIYFTNSARYAADIYSKGHLLLGWVSMREPFPVVGDPNQSDMATLRGRGAHKTYNAHYVPVSPLDPGDPDCAEYHPVQADQIPTCDEYVVFHKSQALPQYWVELEVDLPHIKVPSKAPRFASELIPHLMKILEHPQVDDDLKLRNFLNKHLACLFNLPPDEDLSAEQSWLYEQITQLVTPEGTLNKALRDHMIGVVPAKPLPPAQESKEGAPMQIAAKAVGIEEKEIPPIIRNKQIISSSKRFGYCGPPISEEEELLLNVQRDGMALLHASEELRGNRQIVLAAALQNGWALAFASEELRGDKEIVLAGVQQNGSALKFASKELKGDRKIVLAAVLQNGGELQYASEEPRGDREVVLAAVQRNGEALQYASEVLRGDREIVLAAVQQDGSALKFASKELTGNREIVLAAVQQDGYALIFASEQLKGDRKVVLAAVQKTRGAFYYASEKLQGDSEIRGAANSCIIL